MLVSIIVPAYNVEDYIDECIMSVIDQSIFDNVELVIVNDGSTDNTYEKILKYSSYRNVIIIDQENGGLSNARNRGFCIANGKYVMFLDSDDVLHDNNVLEALTHISEQNTLDMVISDYIIWKNDTNDQIYHHDKNLEGKIITGRQFFDESYYLNKVNSVVWNKLYNREFLQSNNLLFIDGLVYEDMEFTPKAFYLANRVMYCGILAIKYRIRPNSIMTVKTVDYNRLMNYFVIAESISEFNKNFNSRVLKNHEEYNYILIIRKMKTLCLSDLKQIKLKIKENRVQWKLIKSTRLKYKFIGLVLNIIVLSITLSQREVTK